MFVRAALDWSRWVVGTAGAIGVAGVVVAGIATANLAVARTCATERDPGGSKVEETNRPVISVALGGDDCYADALGQFEILGVIVVAVSAVAVRRSGRTASAPAPAAPRL